MFTVSRAEDPAQPPNVDVDGAVDRDPIGVGPRERHAALAREHDARPPCQRLEQSELARLDGPHRPSTVTVRRSRSIVMLPMTVLFDRRRAVRSQCDFADRDARYDSQCILRSGFFKMAVTMSFSSTVVLSKRTHKSKSALDENAPALHVMHEVNGVAKRRAEGARKTSTSRNSRARELRFQRYFGRPECPFTLGVPLRQTGPSRSCALQTRPPNVAPTRVATSAPPVRLDADRADFAARIDAPMQVASRCPNPVVQYFKAGHARAAVAGAVVVRDEIGAPSARHACRSSSGPAAAARGPQLARAT